jgi:phosphosulfolactate synthase (CoM biosynthesis protein A)
MIKTSSGTVYYTQKEMTEKINEVMEDGYRITNAIYDKARDMNWCSEYDDWAEKTNEGLKFFEIPLMRREYAVTYTIERVQRATVTVQVTARNGDDAEDQADEAYSTEELVEKIDDDEWDTKHEEIIETEAQEI